MIDEMAMRGEVSKGGINYLELNVANKPNGTVLWVKAHSSLEEFMSNLGFGESENVEIYGRSWLPVGAEPLKVYRLTQELERDRGSRWTLDSVCGPFEDADVGMVNLSFLRLVGISFPEGVSFRVASPMGRARRRSIKDNVLSSARDLIREYLVPHHMNLRLSTTELP